MSLNFFLTLSLLPPILPQTLAGFSDQDDFCDMVDALEEQGIEQSMDVSVHWLVHHPSHSHTLHTSSHSHLTPPHLVITRMMKPVRGACKLGYQLCYCAYTLVLLLHI